MNIKNYFLLIKVFMLWFKTYLINLRKELMKYEKLNKLIKIISILLGLL
jgi:hypothetical protein